MPMQKQITDKIPEDHTTPLKLLNTRMEVRAGKMIRLEISIAPIIRIPITMFTVFKTAIRKF